MRKEEFASELRLVDEHGDVNDGAVANLIRAPLARWGLTPKHEVIRYVRDQLRAVGFEDLSIGPRVLARVCALGECDQVYVGADVYLAPAEPRWLSTGEGTGTYLGVQDLPKEVARISSDNGGDVVQRLRIESEDDAARLQVAGVREISVNEWLSPIAYLHHASRRLGKPARSDTTTLATFWDLLVDALANDGLPVSSDAEVRAVTGKPGQFFGRHDATTEEGRWTADVPDGVWCAFRRGYGQAHWHPALIAVEGATRRAMDLYDRDEWYWALLARGRRLRLDEVVRTSREEVRVDFPAPTQLRTAMDLLGVQVAPWRWRLQLGAPALWDLVK